MKKFSMKFLPNAIKASMKTFIFHYQVVFALEIVFLYKSGRATSTETSEPKPPVQSVQKRPLSLVTELSIPSL